MFKNGDTYLGGLRFETNNSMLLGSLNNTSTLDDYDIAIGKNINITKNNFGSKYAIAIGSWTEVYGRSFDSSSIAIGNASKAAESAVAINGTASGKFALTINGVASDQGGIAIGPGYSPRPKTTCTWGIAIGQGAEGCGIAIGSAATDNGQYGIVIGSLAKVKSGSIAIGRSAESMALSAIAFGGSTQATADYSVAIGYGAKATTANTIVLGRASETVQIPGSLTVATTSYPSDRNLKNIGKEYTSSLDKIKQLKPFNFTYKDDKNKTPRVGVIAQDLQKVFPNAVSKGKDGFLTIRLEDMFYAVINAIKELDAKITALTQTIKQVQDDNAQLKKENKELREILNQVQNDNKLLKKRLEVLEGK